jgi:hypothetical protein
MPEPIAAGSGVSGGQGLLHDQSIFPAGAHTIPHALSLFAFNACKINRFQATKQLPRQVFQRFRQFHSQQPFFPFQRSRPRKRVPRGVLTFGEQQLAMALASCQTA